MLRGLFRGFAVGGLNQRLVLRLGADFFVERIMANGIDKTKGYIILWRSILDSSIWTNLKLQRLYFWILLRANFKKVEVFPTVEKVILQPGQFITSYPHAADELKMSVGSVKNYLDLLKNERIIEVKSTNKYTVITIRNWESLQNPERKTENKTKTEQKHTETDNTVDTFNIKKPFQKIPPKIINSNLIKIRSGI